MINRGERVWNYQLHQWQLCSFR